MNRAPVGATSRGVSLLPELAIYLGDGSTNMSLLTELELLGLGFYQHAASHGANP